MGFTASTGVENSRYPFKQGRHYEHDEKPWPLMIIALSFAGIFECTGMASSILKKVVKRIKNQQGACYRHCIDRLGNPDRKQGSNMWLSSWQAGCFQPLYKETPFETPKSEPGPGRCRNGFSEGSSPYSTGAGFTEGVLGVFRLAVMAPLRFFGWINPIVFYSHSRFRKKYAEKRILRIQRRKKRNTIRVFKNLLNPYHIVYMDPIFHKKSGKKALI